MQKNTKTPATSPRQSATSNRRRVPRCTEPSSGSFRESTADKPQENICSCSTSVTDSKYWTFGGCAVVLQTPKGKAALLSQRTDLCWHPSHIQIQYRGVFVAVERVTCEPCDVPWWVLNTVFASVPKSFCELVQKKPRIVGIFRPQNTKPRSGTHHGCPIRGLENETQKWT